jgi:plasmid stabilization system protein ParE
VKPVRVHPEALWESAAAVEWYRQESIQVAERFTTELRATVNRIRQVPNQFPIYAFGVRRAVLRGFPFLIVFHVTGDLVEIIVVAHGRRRPGYWKERLSSH